MTFFPVLISFFLCSLPLVTALPIELERGVSLQWPTSPERTYQLEGSRVAGGAWEALGEEWMGDGEVSRFFLSEEDGFQAFRVAEVSPGRTVEPSLAGNGDFEEGSGATASFWSTGGSQPPQRFAGEAYEGGFSMRSFLENAGGGANEGLLSTNVVASGGTIVAGESYRFSFWARQVSSGPSYVQQYEVRWLGAGGAVLASSGLSNFSVSGSDWGEVSRADLVAPANVVEVLVLFRFVTGAVSGGHGEVLIDNVRLDDGAPGEFLPGDVTYLTPELSNVARLSWNSQQGIPYQAETTADLSDWTSVGSAVLGDGSLLSVNIPRNEPTQFYRVLYPDGSGPGAGEVVSLYDATTLLEPATQEETATALITRLGDRARDRHAREAQFSAYDHYLPWYWEERTMAIEITDKVAKGGTEVIFNYETLIPLGAAEFRAFFRGITTEAEYFHNQIADLVGPSQYRATLTHTLPENRPLVIGDRIEIEISQFLAGATHGRNNYYGTTMLYIVGEGIVPWEGKGPVLDSFPLPQSAWLGGLTTLPYQYSNEPEHRFKQMAGNLSPVSAQPFLTGRRLHHTDFGNGSHSEPGNPLFPAQAGKLGPRFVAQSCVACHVNNGRALLPNVNLALNQGRILVSASPLGLAHPTLGTVLQSQSTTGSGEGSVSILEFLETNHQYGDGSAYSLRKPIYGFSGTDEPAYFSIRLAPQLVGLGLLEAVPEEDIFALADPLDLDGDGISGRAQVVLDPETGEARLGRFTSKAGKAKLSHQIAAALNNDMGVTTTIAPVLDGEASAAGPVELSDGELAEMTRYTSLLGVGARRDLMSTQALAGEQQFAAIGCASCHTPTLTTGSFHPFAELRNQTIHPYTDLLLHDMGPGLADEMGEAGASGSEWRTAPLWGIGLTAGVSGGEGYLHDGRARSLQEAILWHGGEAEASKEAFRNLPAADRAAVVAFLKSL